jgi:Flp pilus assembly protein TadD
LARSHNFAQAQEQFTLAQSLAPSDPWPHVRSAELLAAQNNRTGANKEFQVALQMRPGNPDLFGQYIQFLLSTNQNGVALAHARKYAADNPKLASAHYLLSTVLFKQKQWAEAKAEAERTIALDDKFISGYLVLGAICQQTRSTDEAIAAFQKALALQPNSPALQTLIGNLYLEKGDLNNARKCFEQALAVNSKFAVAASNLAWIYTKQGTNLDVALGLAQRAKQLLPDSQPVTDTLGWVQYKRGSYQMAKPLLQECVRKAPQDPMYHYHLGMVLLATGDKASARTELTSALRLKLDGDEARDAQTAIARLN